MTPQQLRMITAICLVLVSGCGSAEKEYTMNAKLPQQLLQYTLNDIKVGESVWTTPWAMWADSDGELWLNGQYTAHDTPGGTVSLKVTRMTDGYHVDIRECPDYRWSTGESSYGGGADPLPVVKLIR